METFATQRVCGFLLPKRVQKGPRATGGQGKPSLLEYIVKIQMCLWGWFPAHSHSGCLRREHPCFSACRLREEVDQLTHEMPVGVAQDHGLVQPPGHFTGSRNWGRKEILCKENVLLRKSPWLESSGLHLQGTVRKQAPWQLCVKVAKLGAEPRSIWTPGSWPETGERTKVSLESQGHHTTAHSSCHLCSEFVSQKWTLILFVN